jgi:cytochrome P450/NADPH-cytochrome P450 reductase
VYAFVKDTKSAFRLPDDPRTPVIMIGPGTGLAPFRGFLQERLALKSAGSPVGPSLLFFGCRHPEQDFIYADELRGFEDAAVTRARTAFSRLPGERKCYVQDRLLEARDEVWDLLERGAVVYVCGDAGRMAPDVRRAFAMLYVERTGAVPRAAEDWLETMVAQDRYLVDVWAAA